MIAGLVAVGERGTVDDLLAVGGDVGTGGDGEGEEVLEEGHGFFSRSCSLAPALFFFLLSFLFLCVFASFEIVFFNTKSEAVVM